MKSCCPLNHLKPSLTLFYRQWLTLALLHRRCLSVLFKLVGYLWRACMSLSCVILKSLTLSFLYSSPWFYVGRGHSYAQRPLNFFKKSTFLILNLAVPRFSVQCWAVWNPDHPSMWVSRTLSLRMCCANQDVIYRYLHPSIPQGPLGCQIYRWVVLIILHRSTTVDGFKPNQCFNIPSHVLIYPWNTFHCIGNYRQHAYLRCGMGWSVNIGQIRLVVIDFTIFEWTQ